MRKNLSRDQPEKAKLIVAEKETKTDGGGCTTFEMENPAVTALKRFSGRKGLKTDTGIFSDLLD